MKMSSVFLICASVALLSATSFVAAQDVIVEQPTLQDGVLQQVCAVFVNAAEGYDFYWLYSSAAEGTMFHVARGADVLPVLNEDHPAWQPIDAMSYYDVGLIVEDDQSKAWLIDSHSVLHETAFGQSAEYFGWASQVDILLPLSTFH